jgi:hypothetical protein
MCLHRAKKTDQKARKWYRRREAILEIPKKCLQSKHKILTLILIK